MEAFWRKNQKLLLSLAMALGLVALFKIFGVLVYETNDDTILASLSYGYYGTPQGLLVYIHPLMGQALALRMGQGEAILCMDRIRLSEEGFLDVGAPVGCALPVVIKTLALGT